MNTATSTELVEAFLTAVIIAGGFCLASICIARLVAWSRKKVGTSRRSKKTQKATVEEDVSLRLAEKEVRKIVSVLLGEPCRNVPQDQSLALSIDLTDFGALVRLESNGTLSAHLPEPFFTAYGNVKELSYYKESGIVKNSRGHFVPKELRESVLFVLKTLGGGPAIFARINGVWCFYVVTIK